MRILVIGGSGFIGTRLISEWLDTGHDVVNLDKRPSATHPAITRVGDIRDEAAVTAAAEGCEAVVNLAAEHRDDVRPVELYEQVNVDGTRNVTAVAARLGITRVVFTSSVAVYGLGRPHPGEDDAPAPFNPYGHSKLAAEGVLRDWAGAGADRSVLIVRPCVVFGEHNRGNVYSLARQVASGRFLMIGPGNNRKAMAYVGNVVAFLATGLTAPPGVTLVNYADTPDMTTRELVSLIRQELGKGPGTGPVLPAWLGLVGGAVLDGVSAVTGRTFPVSAVRIRKFVAETTVGTARLEATGFERPFSLREALVRTLHAEFPDGAVPPGVPGEDVYGAAQ